MWAFGFDLLSLNSSSLRSCCTEKDLVHSLNDKSAEDVFHDASILAWKVLFLL